VLDRYEPNKEFLSFNVKKPFKGIVIKNELLIPEDREDDVRHIVFDISKSGFRYIEGQSVGVIPAGTNEKGKNHKQRIYSIASSSLGDDGKHQTLSLCVKRANTVDDDGVLHKGICSNYICDLKEGDEVLMTGPLGRTLMLPKNQNTKLIILATGTGVTPFRSFFKKIYEDNKSWSGGIDFYFGGKSKIEALYMNELNSEINDLENPNIPFNKYFAFSREMKNKDGGRMYIQHKIEENIEQIWNDIEKANFSFYMCGLKGIEEGVDAVLEKYAQSKGKNWSEMKNVFKKEKRWNVEVY